MAITARFLVTDPVRAAAWDVQGLALADARPCVVATALVIVQEIVQVVAQHPVTVHALEDAEERALV